MTVLPGDGGGSGFSLNHFEFPGNPIKNISQSLADSKNWKKKGVFHSAVMRSNADCSLGPIEIFLEKFY